LRSPLFKLDAKSGTNGGIGPIISGIASNVTLRRLGLGRTIAGGKALRMILQSWMGIASQREIVFSHEFREIVEKNEEQVQCPTIKVTASRLEIRVLQKRMHELEQREQELCRADHP
jgi:hypothetical protein